jgi:hypothetical protein
VSGVLLESNATAAIFAESMLSIASGVVMDGTRLEVDRGFSTQVSARAVERAGQGHGAVAGSHEVLHAVASSKAAPAVRQYEPLVSTVALALAKPGTHVIPEGHEQYPAPSFVPPSALAQRHDQNTVESGRRSVHCAGTSPTTGSPSGRTHGAAPGGASASWSWP